MLVKEMFEELSVNVGIETLKLNPAGEAHFSFDDVVVSIEDHDETVLFISKLAELPQKEELACDFLLKVSNLGKLNTYIGLQEENLLTCVTKLDKYALNTENLTQSLENHINIVGTLRESLTELQGLDQDIISTQNMLRI